MATDRRLFASAAANAALLAALVWSLTRPTPVAPMAPRPATARPPAAAPVVSTPRMPSEGAAGWSEWVEKLRTDGVPNRVIAATVLADFDRRWEQTQRKLQRDFDIGEIDSETLAQAQTEHDREQENELRQALGEGGFRAWQKATLLHDFAVAGVTMSDEESERVYELRRSDAEQRRRLGEAHQRGEIDSAELSTRLAALDSDSQNNLRSVLGEERLDALNPAYDGVEADVRRQLKRANLATNDVAALADVQRARDILRNELREQKGRDPQSGPSFEARRLAIDAARDQAYERILGPAGFEEWQRSSDPRFQMIHRYASAWQLNEADVTNVYAALQAEENQTRSLRLQALTAERQGQSPDWTAVQNNINALAQQTEQSLRRTLGDERFEQLKRNDALAMHP